MSDAEFFDEAAPFQSDELLRRMPFAIVLATLLTMTGMSLYTQWGQHERLAHAEASFESQDVQKALAEGHLIDQKLSDLAHALIGLSQTDPEAQKIVNDMHISVAGMSANAGSAPGK